MNTNGKTPQKPDLHIVEIANRIQNRIGLLQQLRAKIDIAASEKAITAANYDKELAITLIKLKNGVMMELDGNKIQDVPATTAEKISKGICFQQKMDMDMADNKYKAIIVKLETIQAELNGYQSINRYLVHSPE